MPSEDFSVASPEAVKLSIPERLTANTLFTWIGNACGSGATHVRTHLIRAADLAHVWVGNFPDATIGEGALQAAVSEAVAAVRSAL